MTCLAGDSAMRSIELPAEALVPGNVHDRWAESIVCVATDTIAGIRPGPTRCKPSLVRIDVTASAASIREKRDTGGSQGVPAG
jgi:hypothetical protein